MLRLEPIDKSRTLSTTSLSGKTAEVVAVGDMGGICQKAPTSRVEAEKRPDNGNFPGQASYIPPDNALNMNRYSSKKSLAQGMLDIALLTANASQLKYVLQYGPKHEFYATLIVMIAISLFLQARSDCCPDAVLELGPRLLGRKAQLQTRDLGNQLSQLEYDSRCHLLEHRHLSFGLHCETRRPILPVLRWRKINQEAILGILILILSSRNINYKEQQKSADIMNDCVLALSFSVSALNVVLNTMDLKPIPRTTTSTTG